MVKHSQYLHQSTLFKKTREEFLKETGLISDELKQWKQLEILSFDIDGLNEFDEKEIIEASFIKALVKNSEISFDRVLRALLIVREVMREDIPDVFSGIVEVDETYIGGQWKNKRKAQRKVEAKRGRGTLKTPVFGILCRDGKVWAEIVPDVEAKTLMPLIYRQVKQGSVICSDAFKSYTGIASNGYVHRMIEHGKGEYSDKKGNHINGLEGFWGYLKRKIASKGGIRKERLPLYLGEYVWKYNNRQLSNKQKIDKLLSLLYNYKCIKFSG